MRVMRYSLCIIVVILLRIQGFSTHYQDSFTCCSKTAGSCRSSCEKTFLQFVDMAADSGVRESVLHSVRKFCTPELIPFWTCFNETLQAMSRGEDWSGRSCCKLARAPLCRHACSTGSSDDDLKTSCRRSDEQTLFDCVERQALGDECCGSARTPDCHEVGFVHFVTSYVASKIYF
ncbi:reversion-inducing cysteine-rich protein with Kazal motifs-like [Ctenocephalides felis]|uniref:reversion-inducing cysteine-rich protein with Kazal motifs-like n=1 Tax=Ctenocephalides felis TaxID=7515 RepID=UPI000E6E4294|nr:reversion-inducing cysteine-rich protein with Kazal motifs-like [Ctenocephalides felis]